MRPSRSPSSPVVALALLVAAAPLGLVGCLGSMDGASDDGGTGSDGAGGADGGGGGGASAVAGPDRTVLGGLRVPIGGASTGTTFAWTQASGPTLAFEDATAARTFVRLPADATVGEAYVLAVSATGATGAPSTDEVTITVLEAAFQDHLAAIDDPAQLGTSEGIVVLDGATYVASTQGFVSRFDGATFGERFDVGGRPVGMNLDPASTPAAPRFVIADGEGQRVVSLDVATGDVTPLFATLEGGGAVGAANYPLVYPDGTIFLSTRATGTVVRWNPGEGIARIFWTAPAGSNPNSLVRRPGDDDAVYVGMIGSVVRVPILPGGTAGTPTTYVDGFTSEADGLVFDEGDNLWIGLPNTADLLVAAPDAGGATATVTRRWEDVGGDIDGFVNTTFDLRAPTTFLSWANLGGRTVGRLEVGLGPGFPRLP